MKTIAYYGRWTETDTEETVDRALKLCRGAYQRRLVLGQARLSGSELGNMPVHCLIAYNRSRRSLLDRLETHGIQSTEKTGPHNARILVLTSVK